MGKWVADNTRIRASEEYQMLDKISVIRKKTMILLSQLEKLEDNLYYAMKSEQDKIPVDQEVIDNWDEELKLLIKSVGNEVMRRRV